MTVLLGRTSAGTSSDFNGAGNPTGWKFTAASSGTLATLFAQTKVANAGITSVELGIYSDGAGGARPGSKLASATTTDAAIKGTGVFSVDVSGAGVAITAGTVYWLAWRGVGENFDFQGDSSGLYIESGSGAALPTTWPSAGNGSGSINAIIWGEDAGGVTQVSREWALAYDILNQVSREWQLAYDIKNQISNEWALSYDIKNQASREWALAYDIKNQISNEWALAYDIANQVSREWALSYDILVDAAQVSREWALSYDILNQISNEWALSYDVLDRAGREWALAYNIGDVVANGLLLRRAR